MLKPKSFETTAIPLELPIPNKDIVSRPHINLFILIYQKQSIIIHRPVSITKSTTVVSSSWKAKQALDAHTQLARGTYLSYKFISRQLLSLPCEVRAAKEATNYANRLQAACTPFSVLAREEDRGSSHKQFEMSMWGVP